MKIKYISTPVSFSDLLTTLFIGLKLTDKIDWPWILVLSPLWIGLGVEALVLAIREALRVGKKPSAKEQDKSKWN